MLPYKCMQLQTDYCVKAVRLSVQETTRVTKVQPELYHLCMTHADFCSKRMPAILVILCVLTLLGGTTTSQGCKDREIRLQTENGIDYVQYCFRGVWTWICDNDWTDNEATVVCRQLGYGRGQGDTGTQIDSMSNVVLGECDGTESSVQECDLLREVNTQCSRSRAAVQCQSDCTDRRVRLVGGTTGREGRVEVCVNGRWGTVCNNRTGLARAFCAQQGHPSGGALTVDTFGPGVVPILDCTVEQMSLICAQFTNTSCNHNMDLGVVCLTMEELQQIQPCSSTQTTVMTDTPTTPNKLTCPPVTTTCPQTSASTADTESEPVSTTTQSATCPTCPTCPRPSPVTSETDPSSDNYSTTPTSASSVESASDCSGPMSALGVVIGVLFVLSLVTTTGLIVICIKHSRSKKLRRNVAGDDSHPLQSMQQPVYDGPTLDTGRYDLVDQHDQQPAQPLARPLGIGSYDMIDYDTEKQPVTAQPASTEGQANKKEADFYDAEQHTYTMVEKKKKKKCSEDGNEEKSKDSDDEK